MRLSSNPKKRNKSVENADCGILSREPMKEMSPLK